MSKNRELSQAKLHDPIHVPSLGNIKSSALDLASKEFIRPTKMTLMDGYVECDLVNGKGTTETVLIPFSNFLNVVVKKESVAKESKA